ncbi:MAG: hypothetical protein H0X45_15775 [Planctomycetes bacterium]|nr:hypothetical protein [Planctomycetota bacterium]
MKRPIHLSARSGADLYTGFLYPDSGRFSLDCNGSFVGTGHYFAGGELHGLAGRHRAASAVIAAALAAHDPALRAGVGAAERPPS